MWVWLRKTIDDFDSTFLVGELMSGSVDSSVVTDSYQIFSVIKILFGEKF
jgi:hypothetical protein